MSLTKYQLVKLKASKANLKSGLTVLSQKGSITEINFLRNFENLDFLLTDKTISKSLQS